MVNKKDKITAGSHLLFEWRLELPDGQMKTVKKQILAANAFNRGVQFPKEWTHCCVASLAAPGQLFTVAAADEAAKSATCDAIRRLGDACASVLCRCSLFHSLLSTCRFVLIVKQVCV